MSSVVSNLGSLTGNTSNGSRSELQSIHNRMVQELNETVAPNTADITMGQWWNSFILHLQSPDLLTAVDTRNVKSMGDVFECLLMKNKIAIGYYDAIKNVFKDANLIQCLNIIEKYEITMQPDTGQSSSNVLDNEIQSADDIKCHRHQGMSVMFVCSNCNDELICEICVTRSHSDHQMNDIERGNISAKKRLHDLKSHNSKYLHGLKNDLSQIQKSRDEQDRSKKEVKDDIEAFRTRMHELVNIEAENRLLMADTELSKNLRGLDKQTDLIQKNIRDAETLNKNIEQVLKCQTKTYVIQRSHELNPLLPKRTPCDLPGRLQLGYSSMDIEKTLEEFEQTIVKAFPDVVNTLADTALDSDSACDDTPLYHDASKGRYDSPGKSQRKERQLLVHKEFQYAIAHSITVIVPFKKDMCLIKRKRDTKVRVVDENGNDIKTIETSAQATYGLCVYSENEIYLCKEGPNCILQIDTRNIDQTKSWPIMPLKALDICVTPNGNVIYSVVDDTTYKMSPQSRRFVQLVDKDFNKLPHKAEKDPFEYNLFVCPFRVSTNPKGDTVAVVNAVSSHYWYLVLLNSKLHLKMRYLGNRMILHGTERMPVGHMEPRFLISDVAFNTEGDIILCEKVSRSVQLLNKKCEFKQTFFVDNNVPSSLTLAENGKLWIGYENGLIKILT